MGHTITLTDEEFAALEAAAGREGRTVEDLVHAVLAEHLTPIAETPQHDALDPEQKGYPSSPSAQRGMVRDEWLHALRDEGLIRDIPDRRPDTPEEEEALKRLATSIGPGKLASDIVTED